VQNHHYTGRETAGRGNCCVDGVPIEQYSVTVFKTGAEGVEQITTSDSGVSEKGGKVFSYVEPKYSDVAASPFTISVTEKGAAETFEVGKPVHQFLRNYE
jgi:hypothetical protein